MPSQSARHQAAVNHEELSPGVVIPPPLHITGLGSPSHDGVLSLLAVVPVMTAIALSVASVADAADGYLEYTRTITATACCGCLSLCCVAASPPMIFLIAASSSSSVFVSLIECCAVFFEHRHPYPWIAQPYCIPSVYKNYATN